MDAEERRKAILDSVGEAGGPVTAGSLAARLGVSRQAIVHDVAVLRASGRDVVATSRGYVLGGPARAERVFKCRHTQEEIVEEGSLITSLGGEVRDVFVCHRVYGKIEARLGLRSRTDAEELARSLCSGASKPLMSITDNYHYHTVTAERDDVLDEIERSLRERGFLVEI